MKRIVKSLSAAALAALFLTGGLAGQAKAAREDAERYQPKVANKQVEVGNFRFADSFVKNKEQLPKETIFSFTETPDFYRAGSYRTRIIAAYPDWSQDKSKTFTVTVKEKQTDAKKYRPEAKGKTVKMGKSISPASLIKNRHSLPKGTNYSFSSRVNFKKAGSYKTRIALVYPDGSSESSKTIRIKVKDLRKDKEKYRPKVKKVKTAYGKVLYAYQAVTNWRKLPKGTTFSYTKAVNFWKSGKYKRRVLVQYPDKSSEKTSSFYLTVKRQPDNQKYGLRVKNASLWLGQKTTAKKLVANAAALPKKTKYSFTSKVSFKKTGTYWTQIKATYPDKSKNTSAWLKVTVARKPDRLKYQPKVKGTSVWSGQAVSAKQLVTNHSKLPKKTKYSFTSKVSFKKAGTYQTRIKATYPDKSKDTSAKIKITVKKKPDAAVYKAKAVKSASVVRGSVLPAASLIANRSKLPKKTAFAFTVGPNFQKVGSYDTGVVVIYPDGSRQVIKKLTVVVKEKANADLYAPQVKGTATTLKGHPLTAASLITNAAALPNGTKFAFVKAPDFNKAGSSQVKIKVTYPDKSSEETAAVRIQVNASQASLHPALAVKEAVLPVGQAADANKLLTNAAALPAGFSVRFVEAGGAASYQLPNTGVAGTYKACLEVAYPDGSTVQRPVTVKVLPDSEYFKPQAGNSEAALGTVKSAKDLIQNAGELPGMTTYEFVSEDGAVVPDFNQAGTYPAAIKLGYPDQTSTIVKLTIVVK